MKKKMGFIGIVALVSVLMFGMVPAQAGLLSIGGMAGYYNPNFGEINDDLFEEINALTGMDLKFKGGLAYGLAVGYDISPNFKIRGEYNTFTSKTSDSYLYDFGLGEEKWEFKLTTTPIILSGIYRISPDIPLCPYIGAGIGYFDTKISCKGKKYFLGMLVDEYSDSDKDKPIGYQVLGGVEFGGEGFSLAAEARYIIAEAEMEDWGTKVDLGGLFAGLIASIKF